ncbi:hypothetical protein LJC14_00960 [Treponema sp. OttesenSCG-928-L16]|nr:hypothetical protein [Treponema sp. OttesenSCG-928-L16]
MEIISLIGIFVALAVMVIGCMRSVNLVILAPICALIVTISGGIGIVEGYGVNYMTSMGNFVLSNYPVFLTGALFSKFLDLSGLTESIAITLVKRLGKDNIVLAMIICNVVLAVAGVNTFVIIFTMFPIALAMFKEADLPRKLIPACILGPTVVAVMLPGMPTLNNIIPMNAVNALLGTSEVTPLAAPVIGFIGFLGMFVLTMLYLNNAAKKARRNGEHFTAQEGDEKILNINLDAADQVSPLWILLPLAFIIITLNVFRWPAYGSLAGASVIIIICFFKKLKGQFNNAFSESVKNSSIVITTAALAGFGAVVRLVPGFQMVVSGLTSLSLGNPYLFTIFAVAIIAGVTGSAYGGMQIAIEAVGRQILAMGAAPQVVSRLVTMSALSLDSLPHNGAVVLTLNYCGVSHRDGYKYLGMTTVVFPFLVSIIGVILGSLGIA